MSQRKSHPAEFKLKVALEAIKAEKTASQIASKYAVHPGQISIWKKQALEHLAESFKGASGKRSKKEDGPSNEELYCHIGQLKVELDWLKKKSDMFEGR